MNKKQKTIIGVALAVFALTLFAAPWTVSHGISRLSYTTTNPVWDGPYDGQLNVAVLLVEWVGIGVIAGGLVVLFRQKH